MRGGGEQGNGATKGVGSSCCLCSELVVLHTHMYLNEENKHIGSKQKGGGRVYFRAVVGREEWGGGDAGQGRPVSLVLATTHK